MLQYKITLMADVRSLIETPSQCFIKYMGAYHKCSISMETIPLEGKKCRSFVTFSFNDTVIKMTEHDVVSGIHTNTLVFFADVNVKLKDMYPLMKYSDDLSCLINKAMKIKELQ